MMFVRRLARMLCGLMTTCWLVSFAFAAGDQASTPQVKASLIASHLAVSPGKPLVLSVRLEIAPHWHTYWRNPGDSGTVTTIDWSFSQPVTAGDIDWPLPDRFRMGPIVNYGYANQVTLPTQINVPKHLTPGQPLHVQAVVDWLVCKEECIPQQVTLSLDLPVVSGQPAPVATELVRPSIQTLDFPTQLRMQDKHLRLTLDSPALKSRDIQDIWFYPYEWGRIAQSQPQQVTHTEVGVIVDMQVGDQPLQAGEPLKGVLVVKRKAGEQLLSTGYEIALPLKVDEALAAEAAPASQPEALSLWWALLLAFAGGLVLNLMPCVFPVLSIKALSLLSHAELSRRALLIQGLIYTLGVVVSFVALASVLVILKAGGAQIGWGFQFQSPWFVCLMAYLMFAVGLSLSGVFTLGSRVTGVGSSLAEQPGLWGSFFTGVLATVVATPCTAPFMAAALGFALTRPALELVLIFVSLGLGLAAPYLVLTSWPAFQRLLPKPGKWMEYVKQLFAFPMYAASVWLVWVLAQQQGDFAVALGLIGLWFIALAAWLFNISQTEEGLRRHAAIVLVVIALGSALWLVTKLSSLPTAVNASNNPSNIVQTSWQPYSDQTLKQLLAEGKPVFLNLTAAWCVSCLVNEKVALSQPSVQQAFKQEGIIYLKGDWTNKDGNITRVLTRFGRSGVPLYVFYPAHHPDQPKVLPQILTPDIVLANIRPSS